MRFFGLLLITLSLVGCTEAAKEPIIIKGPKGGATKEADGAGGKIDRTEISKTPSSGGKTTSGSTGSDKSKPSGTPITEAVDPNLKLSIPLSTAAVSIGPKAPVCPGRTPTKGKSLGAYINFEVVDPATKINFSVTSLCGDVTQKNVLSVYNAATQTLVKSVELPNQAITSKSVVLSDVSLDKGRYMLALEVAGNRMSDLASIQIEGGELTATKAIKFESVTDY